jgi:hypothetical protein
MAKVRIMFDLPTYMKGEVVPLDLLSITSLFYSIFCHFFILYVNVAVSVWSLCVLGVMWLNCMLEAFSYKL